MTFYYQKSCALLGLILLGLIATGCNSVDPNKFGMPNLGSPGTAAVQQNRAVRFDPYPEPDVAPDTGGLRPREYEKPLAEPLRARWPIID